jgi:hypothetical protein
MITSEATLEFMMLLFGEWTREPEGTAALPDPRVASGSSLSTHLSVAAHSVEEPATPQRRRRTYKGLGTRLGSAGVAAVPGGAGTGGGSS